MISTELQIQVDKFRSLGKKLKQHLSFEEIGEDLILVQNQKSLKCGVLGLLELNGVSLCVSYLINIKKWSWAEQEGFTADDILSKDDLKKEIFTFIPLNEFISELA